MKFNPLGMNCGKHVGVHHDDDADYGPPAPRKCQKNKAKDGAFIADLVGGGGRDADGLRVDHLAHSRAARRCLAAHMRMGADVQIVAR